MPTDPSHQGVPASNPSHNAIPPSLASRFDPVYLSLYNKYNVGKLATHQIPIETYRQDPAKYTITYGRAKGPEVYKTVDLRCSVDGGEITVRVYLPGPVEEKERGAYINFHGGGWVFGGLANAEETLKRMVMEVGCVAFDVDYRLAPEFRYPAAVEDCWSAFQWILKTQITPFNIDTTRLAVGGDSAGGHLAAVISILARDSNLPLSFQLLTVPVADLLASFNEDGSLNENTPYFSYKEMKDTQPLSVERMQYFHEKFLGLPRRKEYENDWKISPIRHPDLSSLAPAMVFVAEMDPLRDEGLAYAAALENAGTKVEEVVVAKGAPHTVMILDEVLDGGKEWWTVSLKWLRKYIG